MIRMGILWIFWTFSLQPKADSHALTDQLTCETDYWHTITCSIQLPVTSSTNKNTSYCLKFVLNDENHTFTCPLRRRQEVHSCILKYENTFRNFHTIDVTLYYSENIHKNPLLDYTFIPAKNIKPNAPYNLTFQYTNGMYNFSWENGYEGHTYYRALPFMYNFLYYKNGHHGINTSVQPESNIIQIDETRFDPDCEYTAMVRTGIKTKGAYKGTWSEWSFATEWKTRHREKPSQSTISQIHMIAVGTCVMLGLIILFLSFPAARMKIKEIVWVPTPATYFQPLYTNYHGNFQGWVLAKSALRDVHVPEECSTIDKFAEVITILQEQAEKPDLYPPVQCHTAYVGPTTELWAPCQRFDTCSETSVPCEDFSLFCEALPDKVDNLLQHLTTACFTEDELSLKASVLSLKSLESLGTCEPCEAPVIINPTPVCFKQDYCTLTDTLTGPVPIFTRDVELNGDLSNE